MSKVKIVILIGFPVVAFLVLYFAYGFDGLYGQDGYEYVRYAQALRDYLISGEAPGDYFWPLYYPILGTLGGFVTQDVGISLLLVSVLSLSLSGLYILKIIEIIFPETGQNSFKKAAFILLFFALSPYIFRHGMVVMSDMLTVLFIVLTVFNYVKYKQTANLLFFYGIAIFSVSAVMTRYASFVIVVPFIIASSVAFLKQKKNFLHFFFLAGTVVFLLSPHFFIREQNASQFLQHPWLQDWSVFNFFKSNFSSVDGSHQYSLVNILYGFSNFFDPRFFALGFIFIPFVFLKKFTFINKAVFVWSFLLYALFLAGIPFQNNRFLVLSFPLIIILCFPVFVYFSELKSLKKSFNFILLGVFLLQLFLISRTMESIINRNTFEKEIVSQLESFQNNTLYSFDVDIALQGRNLQFDYKNMWKQKYENPTQGSLVLFHPSKFIDQWKDKNPILNWQFFNQKYDLKLIKQCSQGWQLYKIEHK